MTTNLEEKLEEWLVQNHRVGERERYQIRRFVAWLMEEEPLIVTRKNSLVALARAIEVIVLRATFDPSLMQNEVFHSTAALARECDPKQVGLHQAADSRAKFKHFAATDSWSVTREQVNDELVLLEAE
jgi:hypothetical protein